MIQKIRNIAIFVVIGLILVAIYFFFIRKPADVPDLVSSTPAATTATAIGGDNEIAQSFLTLLLNIKTIKLNDTIFSDAAFTSLHDSTIILTPDNNTGRPNPFAPLGSDAVSTSVTPVTTQTTTPPATTTTPTTTGTTPPSSSTPPAPATTN